MDFDALIDIAEKLKADTCKNELESLKAISEQENPSMIIPLVGEFSSGKTSLINSLSDSNVFFQ